MICINRRNRKRKLVLGDTSRRLFKVLRILALHKPSQGAETRKGAFGHVIGG